MSISIEDILRGHGIGSSGGVQVLKSETEPTTGLSDGVFWYNPIDDETKMYLNGEFKDIGGAGGSIISPFFGQFTTSEITNEVVIPVDQYVPGEDIILVSQNGTPITETLDYRVDQATRKIIKLTGIWDAGTNFGFTVLATTTTGKGTDNVTFVQVEDHVTVTSGVSIVHFNIPSYNPLTDIMRVHQRNLEIFKDIDWTIRSGNQSIELTYELSDPEEFHFTVTKKIRDVVPEGSIDGASLINGSVSEDKLGFVPATEEDVGLLDAKIDANSDEVATHMADYTAFKDSKGQPNGLAGLGSDGKLILEQMPEIGSIELIEEYDGGGVAEVSFTDIPQTYKDLRVVVFNAKVGSPKNTELAVTINSDTSSSYSITRTSDLTLKTGTEIMASKVTGVEVVACLLNIFEYTSNQQKIINVTSSQNGQASTLSYGKYNKTPPVTSIQVKFLWGEPFASGLKILLYGVR